MEAWHNILDHCQINYGDAKINVGIGLHTNLEIQCVEQLISQKYFQKIFSKAIFKM